MQFSPSNEWQILGTLIFVLEINQMRLFKHINPPLEKIVNLTKKFTVLFLLLSCINTAAYTQNPQTFDSIYNKTAKEIAHKDLKRALVAADSLYRTAEKPLYQIRSLILIARIYQQKEDLEKSVEYSLKAEKLAAETKDYAWQARANGLLSGQYRMMELYNRAKMYSEKALALIPKISDPEKANNTAGLMQQELAFCNMDEENYRQAIFHLQKAAINFQRLTDSKDYLIMTNERLLGQNYLNLKSYDTALVHYQKALNLSSGYPVHYITGMIHKGLAETFLTIGNLRDAKKHLDQAEKIADESQYLQLKDAVYTISREYYTAVNDRDKLALTREKKDSVVSELLDKRANLLDHSFAQMEEKEIKNKAESQRKTGTIFLLCFLLCGTVTGFIVYTKKRRRTEQVRFKAILKQLEAKEKEDIKKTEKEVVNPNVQEQREAVPVATALVLDAKQPNSENDVRIVMSAETEQKLLSGLNEFEKAHLYLDKNLSLTSLASNLATNSKYLSYIIKTHKQADYSTYVNELRVDYIIEKLKNNPEWRQYKISVLAETAGFTSHSQFAAVFKMLKGLSPSAYIRYLAAEAK